MSQEALTARAPRIEYGPSTRLERLDYVSEVSIALIEGRMPSREAALFVAGAVLSWLRRGGDLAKDHWRVTAPRGSHETVQVVASCLQGSSAMRDAEEIARHSVAQRRVIRFDEEDNES